MKLLRKDQLLKIVPVTYPTIWRWEREGKFPKRRRLGPNTVVWLESEVLDFVQGLEVIEKDKG